MAYNPDNAYDYSQDEIKQEDDGLEDMVCEGCGRTFRGYDDENLCLTCHADLAYSGPSASEKLSFHADEECDRRANR
jgi:hypothetical protein